jgi:hypothetical protein
MLTPLTSKLINVTFFFGITNHPIFHSDWLWAGRSGDRIPVGARFFAHFQTGSGALLASCTMGIGSFPEVKRPGRVADHPPPSGVRSRKSRAIPLPLPLGLRVCYGVPLHLIIFHKRIGVQLVKIFPGSYGQRII